MEILPITEQLVEQDVSPILPTEKLITGAELAELGDIGPCELIEGRILKMNPTKYLYGAIEARLAQQLGVFADERGLGVVMSGEVGIYTHRNPDTIRGADVLFISGERLARATLNSFLDVAPELVVEVLSPNDRWGMVKKKLREYFEIGVVVVLVVDPHERTVSVYRSLTQIAELGVGDALELPDVLPGFQLPLDKLFAA